MRVSSNVFFSFWPCAYKATGVLFIWIFQSVTISFGLKLVYKNVYLGIYIYDYNNKYK